MGNINEFVQGWMAHRKALLELAGSINDDQLNFKPWENAMTFSELILHTTGATAMFVEIVKNGEFKGGGVSASVQSVGELTAAVQEQTEKTKAMLESLTEEQLSNVVNFKSMKMPGKAMLQMAFEHEIHHKGQLFTYARIAGVENLPFFVIR